MPAEYTDAKIRWEGDTLPVSSRFDDPYYSRQDGLAESEHVFLAGNRLQERFAAGDDFAIAELGFGTGLNFLAALRLWQRTAPDGARLSYTAFELYPMSTQDMARALSVWPELGPLTEALLAGWPGPNFTFPRVDLTVIRGDARERVPAWAASADAWFLDGFAPARNPEMWEPALMQAVHDRTRPGGSFATYAAAGHVRRSLTTAGFQVTRAPGFGRKREMLTGIRESDYPGSTEEAGR